MAEKKAKRAEAVEDTPVTAAETQPEESVYTADELADNYKVFGTFREIVAVALRMAGKETATFSEAQRIVNQFKHKEV